MKRTNKNIIITAVAVLLVLALIILGPRLISSLTDDQPNLDSDLAVDLMQDVEVAKETKIVDLSEQFIDGNFEFSLNIFKEISEEENPVYSPLPVYLSLALLSNGAETHARDEIIDLLNKDSISEEDLNLYYMNLIEKFTENKGDTELNISNSIWFDKDFKADEDFLNTNKSYYGAYAYRTDFKNEQTPEVINKWVEDVTNGRIKEMVDDINEETVMILFSSIYFDAKWDQPFSQEKTFMGDFFLDKDQAIQTDMMSNTLELKSINDEEASILLPYNDDKYAFLAIMPEEGVDIRDYINDLEVKDVKDKIEKLEENRLNIVLPKFELEFSNGLASPLKKLGVRTIFDPNQDSLSGVGESTGNLYVSNMKQKTYIRVDEEGTEAASVVETDIETTSIVESINFNRPFLYMVWDTELNLPLFMGIMDDPSKN